MNTSFSSMMWRNQSMSMNQSFNQSQSGFTPTYSMRQRTEYIMSTKTNFVLDPFGAPLPSMVKSLLNQAVDGQKISCRVDPNGWAWLVCGRRLYIWRHSFSNESKRSNIIACRELWLPTSELDHQAQLVCIVTNTGFASSVPACIAVSPEGQITYWPNVSNDSGTITISADIPGQECESLSSLWPHALILTTTTSTILLIKPCYTGSKPSLSCTPLILNKGWFGTIGRRVTSMLFNPIPTSSGNEMKRSRVVVPVNPDDPSQPGAKCPFVYVVHGPTVQTWELNAEHQFVQLYSINLEETLRRSFVETAWSSSVDHMRRIQICLVDVDAMANQNIAVLAAAYDSAESSPMVYYGIITLDARVFGGKDFKFILVDHRAPYVPVEDDHRTSELFSWRILALSNFFCMVNPDSIILIPDKPNEPIDVIDAASSGGSFLGFGRVSEGTVTVFAPKHGIMAIKPGSVDGLLETSYTEFIKVPENLAADVTQYNFEDVMSSEDSVNRLKTAFLAFITKKTNDCQDIINTLFPRGTAEWSPHESIDMTAIALCEKLIDDAPPSDQRSVFASAEPDHMGYKSKQLIFRCLNSKKEVVELYLGFLSNVNILQQLSRVVVKEDTIATASILYNDYEKIGFALALHHLQSESQYRDLIEAAIHMIVRSRSDREAAVRSSHMGTNEQFYKDVSRIYQIIRGLVAIEEEQLSSALPSDMPEIVGRVNEIILRSVSEMSTTHLADKLAKVKQSLITPLVESPTNEYEILPWLVSRPVLPHLLRQHHLTVSHGLNVTEDSGIRVKLAKELQELTDLILDNMRKNLDSLKHSDRYTQRLKKFEETRHTLLKEFLEIKDYDGALAMAEKYLDFDILVTASVERGDYEMLEHYFDKYDTFPEFTFEWFVKQKKHNELVTQFVHSRVRSRLGRFLQAYPELLWHYQTIVGDIHDASVTLKQMAFSEESDPEDRLLYLQLSKLGLLASGVPAEQVDAMREYDETNYKEDVDLDKLSNMSLNEAALLPTV